MVRLIAPQPRAARAAVILLLGVWAGLAAACSRPRPPARPPAAPPAPAAAPAAPSAPIGKAVLTRAELIAAAAAARDAYARGAPYPAANAELIGRRFSVRLPFGCATQTDADVARIAIDPTKQSLTLAAQPQVWTGAAWLAPMIGPGGPVEAAEGFWIRWPWTNAETCPATPAPLAAAGPEAASPAASPETLGLVRIFRTGDSRLKRHTHHPYRVVLKLSDTRIPLDRRFWLVLEGRLASLDGEEGKGQPIRCAAPGVDVRPTCLVAVELDHVAIAAQATGDILADWPG